MGGGGGIEVGKVGSMYHDRSHHLDYDLAHHLDHDTAHHLDHDLGDQLSLFFSFYLECAAYVVDDTGGLMDGPCDVDAS